MEGPIDDPDITDLRERQRRNLMATLLLAQGTPMVLAGDEFGRTQGGNNDAYAQDNASSQIAAGEATTPAAQMMVSVLMGPGEVSSHGAAPRHSRAARAGGDAPAVHACASTARCDAGRQPPFEVFVACGCPGLFGTTSVKETPIPLRRRRIRGSLCSCATKHRAAAALRATAGPGGAFACGVRRAKFWRWSRCPPR